MSSKNNGKQPDPSPEVLCLMKSEPGRGIPDDVIGGTTSDEHYSDPLDGIAFGYGVLEHVLLAIIDGNPNTNRREDRLRDAMVALVGREPFKAVLPTAAGKPDEYGQILEKALLHMGASWFHDKEEKKSEIKKSSSIKKKKPSARSLAKAAVKKFLPTEDPHVFESRVFSLAERFTGRYLRNHTKGIPQHNVPMTYAYRAVMHDYVRESVEHQIIARICQELERTGVRVSIPEN